MKLQEIFVNPQSIVQSFGDSWLVYIVGMIFVIMLVLVMYKMPNTILESLKVAKVKFPSTEIEITGDDKDSIYNKYLDELLYFFEETQYEIIIFEDIDRFGKPSIFTNLREINTFLNNYENIERRIIFIYAIKENIFEDRERTKFFDFIIPVIPCVDSFNSSQVVFIMSP
ncbi:hypothetical protein SAMN02745945_00569 [Peptoclostridium litorale DSM 5388]|uniref:YobI-like P-loop NTPase domain-containing protein n=1 Tax=Peptoclostridium litorale DSM 5388 TaxID=1121324 RepID=A0A069RE95_PEPLI|nr:hypothetical protein [Peptoclostridium litorale]KDR95063.1 hypothetical protein CLIT_11c00920 [Peptoclostridium litorale DSM 5388]SIN75621.1 hypothetical protein SAMN02745945_00569 [Peptoclostridium litorale DSM 5388]